VESVYFWEGKVQSDEELLLKIKTRRALVGELTTAVKALHPYDECEASPRPFVTCYLFMT
jgi:periplasmic divalent cation tolerance protein